MNHARYYQILVIFLFIILSVGFCFGEVVIRVFNNKTGKFEDFVMTPELRAKYDRQEAATRRQMMEECPSGPPCIQEEAVGSGPVILTVPSEGKSQSQWQIPTFTAERRGRRETSSPPALSIVPSGFFDSRGNFYVPSVTGGYVNSKTGEFVPMPNRPW